jgi:hypothetical protein
MPKQSSFFDKLPQGTIFEYRVARLRFCQGYFVRRSIDVWPPRLEGNKLAELDCFALSFDPQLRRFLEVIECKTGSGSQGEIDRLLWLKGISTLTNSSSVSFAKLKIAPRSREFARHLGVDVLDADTIDSIEKELGINKDWWPGFHDPVFGEQVVAPARRVLTNSEELQKAGKYLYGSYWFADDFTRIKQLRRLFGLLKRNSPTLPLNALLLGIGEATTLFAMTALSISSWRNQLVEAEFTQLISEELSTGLGDPRGLRNLLRRIDDIQRNQIEQLHEVYQRSGVGRVPFSVKNLEVEILKAPEWVEAFVDLVTRLSNQSQLATALLRRVDLWSAGLLGDAQAEQYAEALFGHQKQDIDQLLNLILAFLERVWDVPTDPELLRSLATEGQSKNQSRNEDISPGNCSSES